MEILKNHCKKLGLLLSVLTLVFNFALMDSLKTGQFHDISKVLVEESVAYISLSTTSTKIEGVSEKELQHRFSYDQISYNSSLITSHSLPSNNFEDRLHPYLIYSLGCHSPPYHA